ncbi:hypothetical protein C7B62_12640 [Pleurocapsa sp. CCALA 161]|uniref:hypothetical protein n=1 Tax=Pleurocapsa sp. CCALA 161 TaxID=2107688 RepID=UPI000D082327|nr:hypothetical protein [Pleurocapsa sp. CCALA 161]PSB09629.1 hypothetical protein C7B62_12640 [Pleurocapsa sp. CCALA 161]
MKFDKNKQYSRREIQKIVGGEIQTYLPQKNHRILAGCFCRELNPDAPKQIQAGKGTRIYAKARLLAEQPETIIPVFIKNKEKDKCYQYIGNYKYKLNSITKDISKIKEAEEKSKRSNSLSCLFDLVKVS